MRISERVQRSAKRMLTPGAIVLYAYLVLWLIAVSSTSGTAEAWVVVFGGFVGFPLFMLIGSIIDTREKSEKAAPSDFDTTRREYSGPAQRGGPDDIVVD
jgi:hypothetical protein